MTFNRYPRYKKKNSIWFDVLPINWDIGKLKHCLQTNDGGVWGSDTANNNNMVLRSTEISIDGKWRIDNPAMRTLTDNEVNKALLKTGDLLITKSSGSEAHIGKTALVTQEIEELNACYSNFMQRIHPKSNFYSKYLYYFLNSYLAREEFNYFSTTTTGLANLNTEIISNLVLPFPHYSEQKAIADFLDLKTSQIDTLITKKHHQIELLQKYRTALINQAVTKGLDPNVPMKDSGIDWLGKIPKHYQILQLKYLTEFNYGNSLPQDNRKTGIIPVFGSNGTVGYHNEGITKSPCIVIGRKGSYGKVNFSKSECFPIDTTFFVDETSTKNDIRWVYYLLLSLHLDSYSRDSAVPGLNREEAYQKKVILPPINEQISIAKYLDSICAKIELANQKLNSQINLLEEYRITLISESVTGKIDVRNQG